jgi:glycosyltransferase involved in cell wall biosynthesis
MILVWMPVYNEALYLHKAITSVLAQTHTDFVFIISDNHSTDGSTEIIDDACRQDPRVQKVSPPTHLKSTDHALFLYSEIFNKSDEYIYSIFIGGHDVWLPNLLECLINRADADPNSAIVFTDSYKLDKKDNALQRYEGIVHVAEVPLALRPHYVLTGLTFNVVWGGLWRESKRKMVPQRHRCSGADHLMVAEIALHGNLIYAPGSVVYLRDNSTAESGHDTYVKKHLPKHYQDNPILDFALQLEWASYLIDKAASMDPFYQQDLIKNMLKNSLVSAYICRYWNNLLGFDKGFETFFNNERVRQLMASANQSNSILAELLQETIAAGATSAASTPPV